MEQTQQYNYDEIKEQIIDLINKLPVQEAGQQQALLMAFELQQKLQQAITGNSKNKTTVIKKITEEIKALDVLIDLNKKISDLYSGLTDKGKEETSLLGHGIRNHIKRKNEGAEGNNNSGVHKRAG